MKTFFEYLGKTLLVLIGIDLLILFFSLLQLKLEGRTGEWHPFWSVQVEIINGILN